MSGSGTDVDNTTVTVEPGSRHAGEQVMLSCSRANSIPWSAIARWAASKARSRDSATPLSSGPMMKARPAARVAAVAPYDARCTSKTASRT